MKKKRFTEEQVQLILKESKAGFGTQELCRKYGISKIHSITGFQNIPEWQYQIPSSFEN